MKKKLQFETSPDVCSSRIDIEIGPDDRIAKVKFYGGCPGNITGVSRLVVGMEPAKAIELLRGIPCGPKKTSCPDQLAKALEEMLRD